MVEGQSQALRVSLTRSLAMPPVMPHLKVAVVKAARLRCLRLGSERKMLSEQIP